MCRQAGLILGAKRRSCRERDELLAIFGEVLLRSERGGPHATGVVVMRDDLQFRLAKGPVVASAFLATDAYEEVLAGFDGHATAVIGHTRWRTRGSERNNANNHPIRAAGVIATHNGTIVNADELFFAHEHPRDGEVDSEILCHLAGDALGPDGIDPGRFLPLVALCQGQLSAILVAEATPGRVVALKGNMPLEFRYSRKYRAVAYASDGCLIDEAAAYQCGVFHDWRPLLVDPMTMLVFDVRDVFRPEAYRLHFGGS